jgi:cation transport regulator ChaC
MNNNQGTNYYFAYGRNMSKTALNERFKDKDCEIEKIIATREHGILYDYELLFNKKSSDGKKSYANVQISKGNFVEGVLYHFETDEFIKCLDSCEGHPIHYDKVTLNICKKNNTYVEAFVYIANTNHLSDFLKPEKEYIDCLLEASDLLSPEYIEKIKLLYYALNKCKPVFSRKEMK